MVSFRFVYQYQSDCQIQQPTKSGFNLFDLFVGLDRVEDSILPSCPWSPDLLSLATPHLKLYAGPRAPSAHWLWLLTHPVSLVTAYVSVTPNSSSDLPPTFPTPPEFPEDASPTHSLRSTCSFYIPHQ